MEVEIQAYGRVHLGLLSMHRDGFRRNGGIGFMLQGVKALIIARSCSEIEIVDSRDSAIGSAEKEELIAVLDEMRSTLGISFGVSLEITGNMPTHLGFGSGTAIRLAAVEAYSKIAEVGLSKGGLQLLSQRGGTSGVGIHGYFDGGFIFDLGVKMDDTDFAPSSSAIAPKIPLLFGRTPMPNWELSLIVPKFLNALTRDQERKFFQETLPLSVEESSAAVHVALFGVQAALFESDYDAFCNALGMMQQTRWKASERNIYGGNIHRLENQLKELGASGVAMSSLGPSLAVFAPPTILNTITEESRRLDVTVIRSSARNKGRKLAIRAQ